MLLFYWSRANQLHIKNNYLYFLTSPLERKFHGDYGSGLVKFHTIPEGPKFLIEYLGIFESHFT